MSENIVLDDIFTVKTINKDGKFFKKGIKI
jgi:hypothetical protein